MTYIPRWLQFAGQCLFFFFHADRPFSFLGSKAGRALCLLSTAFSPPPALRFIVQVGSPPLYSVFPLFRETLCFHDKTPAHNTFGLLFHRWPAPPTGFTRLATLPPIKLSAGTGHACAQSFPPTSLMGPKCPHSKCKYDHAHVSVLVRMTRHLAGCGFPVIFKWEIICH